MVRGLGAVAFADVCDAVEALQGRAVTTACV
jgi:hypothetical protein